MQNTNENKFFEKLREVFIGVPVEGESGYINLMRIKARYFEKVMEPRLRKEIDNALKPFPDFREELFDKLYTFFHGQEVPRTHDIAFLIPATCWMGCPIPDHLRCRGALRCPAFPQHSGDRARRCFGGTGAQLRSRETQRKRLRG